MKHKHYEVLTLWLADQTLELEAMGVNGWVSPHWLLRFFASLVGLLAVYLF